VTPIYLLAFDHRSSFSRDLLGIAGEVTDDQAAQVEDLKQLVFEGFQAALDGSLDPAEVGLLVDEQYGAEVAREARRSGVVLAMPVERSGQAEYEPEFGDAFGEHVERFDPTFAKVLVRYDPWGNRELNARQAARLRTLSQWLKARERRLLLELLVPVDEAVRPRLVVEAVRQLQDAGVEPDIWKIEGLDRREDCVRVARQARSGGRDHVTCIVLGRGADEQKVAQWLVQAAPVPGFAGFAVGRTLWWNELSEYVAGTLDRAEAAQRIAARYRRLIDTYTSAAAAA
jgi:myo-inositol catabolism protein IolC